MDKEEFLHDPRGLSMTHLRWVARCLINNGQGSGLSEEHLAKIMFNIRLLACRHCGAIIDHWLEGIHFPGCPLENAQAGFDPREHTRGCKNG